PPGPGAHGVDAHAKPVRHVACTEERVASVGSHVCHDTPSLARGAGRYLERVVRIRSALERFEKRLRRLRIEREWSQRELARRAHLAHVTVRRVERDEQDPSLQVLRQLARALQLPLRDLVDPLPAPPRMPLADGHARLVQLDAEEKTLMAE